MSMALAKDFSTLRRSDSANRASIATRAEPFELAFAEPASSEYASSEYASSEYASSEFSLEFFLTLKPSEDTCLCSSSPEAIDEPVEAGISIS